MALGNCKWLPERKDLLTHNLQWCIGHDLQLVLYKYRTYPILKMAAKAAIMTKCYRYSSWTESPITVGPSMVYWVWPVVGPKWISDRSNMENDRRLRGHLENLVFASPPERKVVSTGDLHLCIGYDIYFILN